jgi:hypothetical protein
MQPATNSARPAEDLHAILSRFQTWSGKQQENHNGHKHNSAGVREIPMEEAMRQLRSRRAKPAAPIAEQPPAPQPPVVPAARKTKVEAAPKPVPVIQAVAPVPTATLVAVPVPEPKPASKAGSASKARPTAPSAKKAPAAKCGAAPQERVQPSEAMRPAKRKVRKLAKRKRHAVRKPAQQGRTVARTSGVRKTRAKRQPPFREVLVRSVWVAVPKKQQERRQRVSVRLSKTEERQLQQRATQAGLTISEYLRRSALEAKAPQSQTTRGRMGARSPSGRPTAAPLFAHSKNQNNSMLGGWIALLRNRFLASPARFAERA